MKNSKPKNVDAYIANSAKEAIPLLKELRELILLTVPNVEEGISWNVPFYKYHGSLAGFATYKNHISFGFATGVIENEHRKALEKKGYKTGTKTIQIKFGQKVPRATLKQILKTKASINKKIKNIT